MRLRILPPFVSIDGEGNLRIDRGYVRPEDEPAVEPVEADGGWQTSLGLFDYWGCPWGRGDEVAALVERLRREGSH